MSAPAASTALPLAGRRILVTRAAAQAGRLTTLLQEQGAEVTEVPVIEIRPPSSYKPLDRALFGIGAYRWLILTSVNGVEAMFARMAACNVAPGKLGQLNICAIGPATRAALEAQGVSVAVVPRRYVAESVVTELRDKVRGRRVLLVRAAVARDVIPERLRAAGAKVDVVEAYQTTLPSGAAARLRTELDSSRRPDAVTFTSSSTVRHLVAITGGPQQARQMLRGIALASIGPVTSNTLREMGLQPSLEAGEYTMTGLVQALTEFFAAR